MLRCAYLLVVALCSPVIACESTLSLSSMPYDMQSAILKHVIHSRLDQNRKPGAGILAVQAPLLLVDLKRVSKSWKSNVERTMRDASFKQDLTNRVVATLKSFSGEIIEFKKGETKELHWSPSDIDNLPVRFERKFFSSDATLRIFAQGLLGYKKALDAIASGYVVNATQFLDPYYRSAMHKIAKEYKEFGQALIEYEQNRSLVPLYTKEPYDDDIALFMNYSIVLFNSLDVIAYSAPWDQQKIEKRKVRYDAIVTDPHFQFFNDTRLFLYLLLDENTRRASYEPFHKTLSYPTTNMFKYVTAAIKKLVHQNK